MGFALGNVVMLADVDDESCSVVMVAVTLDLRVTGPQSGDVLLTFPPVTQSHGETTLAPSVNDWNCCMACCYVLGHILLALEVVATY